jgi:hypothetical protein
MPLKRMSTQEKKSIKKRSSSRLLSMFRKNKTDNIDIIKQCGVCRAADAKHIRTLIHSKLPREYFHAPDSSIRTCR